MDEILKFKGSVIENFKKLNEDLDKPLNYKEYIEDDYPVKKYVGKKIKDKYEGRGILYGKEDNIIYNGYFKNGEYEGFGRLYKKYNDKHQLKYIGYFKNNKYNGIGILYSNEQIKYEGNFLDGEYNGIGIEYLINGKRKMMYEKGKPLKECYGILYDKNNNEIYQGLLKEQKPKNAKSASIYYDYGKIKYIGNFSDFKFNGKGILYYDNGKYKNEIIYFNGIFKNDKLEIGILFSPEGNKLYEGEFIDNYPKEGKNVTIYNIHEDIEYIGDLLNGKFDGYGKLYEMLDGHRNFLKYEGSFKDGLYHGFGKGKLFKKYSEFLYKGNFVKGKMEGNGILYYENGKNIFCDSTFKDNDLYGKGIIYYYNNSKKIEGIFDNLNTCQGIYYNPKGEEIYKGLITNEIPDYSDNAIVYDNYCYKIYEGQIKNGAYNGKGIEYSDCIENLILHEGNFINNYFIEPNNNLGFKKIIKAILYSKGLPGKTCLLKRLTQNYFLERSLATVGVDFDILKFEYKCNEYKIQIWDTNGSERFRAITSSYLINTNIILIIIDLTDLEGIDKSFIEEIKSKIPKNALKYLVLNKIDLLEEEKNNYIDNLFEWRKKAKLLIENKEIDYYFEVSAKNKKGIDNLLKNIKWYILRKADCHKEKFSKSKFCIDKYLSL